MTESIPALRKRRGVTKASITRLTKSLRDLEGKVEDPKTLGLTQRLSNRLENLDKEFRETHQIIMDLTDDEDALGREQEELDNHDEEVSLLMVEIERLIASCNTSPDSNVRKTASRRIARLKKGLEEVQGAISEISGGTTDVCLLHHHQEQLADHKRELQETTASVLPLDLGEVDELETSCRKLRNLSRSVPWT